MLMTPEARALFDAAVARILERHALADPQRAGVHYELMSRLHAGAEQKATAAGRATIEAIDLHAAIEEAGGEAGLARAYVDPLAPLARSPERVLFWRRFGAFLIDAIILSIAWALIGGVLSLALAPAFGETIDRSDPFGPDFDGYFFPDGDWFDIRSGPTAVYRLVSGIAFVALTLGYYVLLEGRDGRTLGKRAVGLRVVRTDGAPVTYREAAIRSLVKINGLLLFLDTLVMLVAFRDEKQRVSDRIAGTAVVRA